jgi:hypothetical protein
MTAILEARQRLLVKRIDIAAAIGRSVYWVSRVEEGLLQITPEEQAAVLHVITRLAAFERAMLQKRQEFLADLRLPPPPARSAGHAQ